MNIPVSDYLSLLHGASSLALATHSQSVPGYPFVTVLPFAIAADHSIWLLMSELAEHYRNVRQDGRVSVLLQAPGNDVFQRERMTLTGDLLPQQPDDATLARLLRYCPDFADYLALGDFHFYRLQLNRVRFIGGFGRMGWLEPQDCTDLPLVDAALEQSLLANMADTVLGLDYFGVDCLRDGQRRRLHFPVPAEAATLAERVSARMMAD